MEERLIGVTIVWVLTIAKCSYYGKAYLMIRKKVELGSFQKRGFNGLEIKILCLHN